MPASAAATVPHATSPMRKLALTLLQRLPGKKRLKRKRKKAARDDSFLHQQLAHLPLAETVPLS